MAGLSEFPATAVLRAEDLNRARAFYSDVLGLKESGEGGAGGGVMFAAGNGSMIMLYERPGMAAPENTTLGFSVPADRFDAVMAELRSRGVQFEEYDIPEIGLKTVDGVADYDGMRGAWFLDSEGNVLNIGTM